MKMSLKRATRAEEPEQDLKDVRAFFVAAAGCAVRHHAMGTSTLTINTIWSNVKGVSNRGVRREYTCRTIKNTL